MRTVMENIDQRIATIEATLERHSQRILNIEGKLENDYKSIQLLLSDVKQLKAASDANAQITSELVKKVAELDSAFSDFMQKMTEAQAEHDLKVLGISKMMKKQNKLLWVAIFASVGAVVYSTIRNGNIAGAVTTLIGLISKLAV